jgi:hypothetical protein
VPLQVPETDDHRQWYDDRPLSQRFAQDSVTLSFSRVMMLLPDVLSAGVP